MRQARVCTKWNHRRSLSLTEGCAKGISKCAWKGQYSRESGKNRCSRFIVVTWNEVGEVYMALEHLLVSTKGFRVTQGICKVFQVELSVDFKIFTPAF